MWRDNLDERPETPEGLTEEEFEADEIELWEGEGGSLGLLRHSLCDGETCERARCYGCES